MAATRTFLVVCVLLGTTYSARVDNRPILTVLLETQGLQTFGQMCADTLPGMYEGNGIFTVFAPNQTAFNRMNANRRAQINGMSEEELQNYVLSLTLDVKKGINEFRDGDELETINGKHLYFAKRARNYWTSGGTTGNTIVYVNGAEIITEQIQALNGMIHVLGRVPSPVSSNNVYNFLVRPDDPGISTTMFKDQIMTDQLYRNYYLDAIKPIAGNQRVTFFLPSEGALRNIPSTKLIGLQGRELADCFMKHFIPGKVVFTSYIENNEHYQSGVPNTNIIFRRFEDQVYVISGGVTAKVETGNITVANGVIHKVDRLLDFVYSNALEQIRQDASYFAGLLDRLPDNTRNLVTAASGVNLLVPSNEAFNMVESLTWYNLGSNMTRIIQIVELCLVKDGSIEVSKMNGQYDVRERRISQFDDWRLVLYNDRNDTWVNAGNVRARIIRPDIAVTTGRLQYIDAVPGVPSMDIPTLIFYDDWLLRTSYFLDMTGLNDYMADPRYEQLKAALPPRSYDNLGQASSWWETTTSPYGQQYPGSNQPYPGNNNQQYPGNNNQQYPGNNNQQYPGNNNQQYPGNNNQQYPGSQYPGSNNQYPQQQNFYQTCGDYNYICEFTFFVPNGTAIEHYHRSELGRKITQDLPRYRFILRRLLIPHQKIYLEQLQVSQNSYDYWTDSHEMISIRKDSPNTARIYWAGETARIIMWDLGATNGVVHIIDNVMSDLSDLTRDISRASSLLSQNFTLVYMLFFLLALYVS